MDAQHKLLNEVAQHGRRRHDPHHARGKSRHASMPRTCAAPTRWWRAAARAASWCWKDSDRGGSPRDQAFGLRSVACLDSDEVNPAQFGRRLAGLAHLPLEEGDLLEAFLGGQLQRMRVRAAGLRLDHLADLREREAELLALHDQREPVAVRAAEDAPASVALRRDAARGCDRSAARACVRPNSCASSAMVNSVLLGAIAVSGLIVSRRRGNPEYVLSGKRIGRLNDCT